MQPNQEGPEKVVSARGRAGAGVDWFLLLVMAVSAPLIFWGLGDQYLWQDEAQTALLGRSVLEHGVPLTGTGAQSVSANLGEEAGVGGLHLQIPWGQAYLVAICFALFGQSSATARLPFALFGWLCIPALYTAARRLECGRTVARIGVVLLATNVWFLISARQARYYTLAVLGTLWALTAYANWAREADASPRGRASRSATLSLIAAVWFLTLSFDLAALGVVGGLAADWTIRRFIAGKSCGGRAELGLAVVASTPLLGWIALASTAPSRRAVVLDPIAWFQRVRFYAAYLNAHEIPWLLAGVIVGAMAFRNPARGRKLLEQARLPLTVMVFMVASAAVAKSDWARYVVGTIGPAMILGALIIAHMGRWAGRARTIVVAAAIAAMGTTVPYKLSDEAAKFVAARLGVEVRRPEEPLTVPLADLLCEIANPPLGPVAAAVRLLAREAKPGDVIVASYGDLPLKFHTGLEVYGGETGALPPDGVEPRWLWPRGRKPYRANIPAVRYIRERLAGRRYEPLPLDVPERDFENREDPHSHIFCKLPSTDRMSILYRRAPGHARVGERRQVSKGPTEDPKRP